MQAWIDMHHVPWSVEQLETRIADAGEAVATAEGIAAAAQR
jgi:hypothetical protein